MNNQHLYSDENLNSDLILILKEIKISFLKEDINSKYADKQIFLYDSPELKEISSNAIVTPKYIFIDSDHFTELSTYYDGQPHRKNK